MARDLANIEKCRLALMREVNKVLSDRKHESIVVDENTEILPDFNGNRFTFCDFGEGVGDMIEHAFVVSVEYAGSGLV